MRSTLAAVLALLALLGAAPASAELVPTPREGADHAVPLFGELLRPYEAPEDNPYVAGHRGLDVGAEMGTPVRASADGVVSFSGVVAGNSSVTIDHGDGIRTSYSFLQDRTVSRGQTVQQSQIVGAVGRGHTGDMPPHVHLSARRDEVYFDPMRLYIGSSYSDLVALTG